MTQIDTLHARKYWKNETKYLERINFVAIGDEAGESVISLSADEEANGEIILTNNAVRWLIKKLEENIEIIEDGRE